MEGVAGLWRILWLGRTICARPLLVRSLQAFGCIASLLAVPPTLFAAGPAFLVKDIYATGMKAPANLTAVGNLLFFTTEDGSTGYALWRSDGTETGTVRLTDILPGPTDSSPTELTEVAGLLFFAARHAVDGMDVWRSDGTETGTWMVKDLTTEYAPTDLVNVSGTLFFIRTGWQVTPELWRSDGTDAGTVSVVPVGLFGGRPVVVGRELFAVISGLGDQVFDALGRPVFNAQGLPVFQFRELLWKSDGSAAGSGVVPTINPVTDASNPAQLVNFNGALYFTATEDSTGKEIRRSPAACGGAMELTRGRNW